MPRFLRRQRSRVRIVSGAPILSGIFAISALAERNQCHRGVTDNFKLTKSQSRELSSPTPAHTTSTPDDTIDFAGITILHCPAFAETAKPNSTATPAAISAPLRANGQSSKKTAKDCDDEWRADQKAMMEHGMTENSYVEQCSMEDDVPAIPSETKTNTAPSPAPK
jgi:hypothetical protein